jgi:hypothetical protein
MFPSTTRVVISSMSRLVRSVSLTKSLGDAHRGRGCVRS